MDCMLNVKVWLWCALWGAIMGITLAVSSLVVCVHTSFARHFRAPFCEIASFAFQSTFCVCQWLCLLVRAGHGIWWSQGERWNTYFKIFCHNGCLLIFPALWRLPGIVSLKLFHFGREKENGLCWSCFVPVGTAAVLSRADTVGEEAITVALALTKTLHLQREEEITPQWCLTLLPHSGSWALGPMNCYTTATTMAVIQTHKYCTANQQL